MKNQKEMYNELACYTLSLGDEELVHQYIVDAFGAQNVNEKAKPIGICFALAGLYLYLEKDYTGRQVQLAHMQMVKKRKRWPALELPEFRGEITIADVLDNEPGEKRNDMIRKWRDSVWQAYSESHDIVATLVNVVLYD